MESVIYEYIGRELIDKPELLLLKQNTPLLQSGILDSLAVLKLVLFLEERFGVVVAPEDLIPENFETVDAICAYLRALQQLQRVQL